MKSNFSQLPSFFQSGRALMRTTQMMVVIKVLLCFQVSPKELKEVLRRQWSQLSDKRRLKWISKALELQKEYEVMQHNDNNKKKKKRALTFCVCVCVRACMFRRACGHITKLIQTLARTITSAPSSPKQKDN